MHECAHIAPDDGSKARGECPVVVRCATISTHHYSPTVAQYVYTIVDVFVSAGDEHDTMTHTFTLC